MPVKTHFQPWWFVSGVYTVGFIGELGDEKLDHGYGIATRNASVVSCGGRC